MAALETADRQEGDVARAKSSRLKDKIAALREQMNLAPVLRAAPDEQISLTAPDARSMATSGRARGIVGYNVQIAADAELYLVVAHEVTHVGHDREQLSSMAGRAKAAMGVKARDALAYRGYFKGAEVMSSSGSLPMFPKPLTSVANAGGGSASSTSSTYRKTTRIGVLPEKR